MVLSLVLLHVMLMADDRGERGESIDHGVDELSQITRTNCSDSSEDIVTVEEAVWSSRMIVDLLNDVFDLGLICAQGFFDHHVSWEFEGRIMVDPAPGSKEIRWEE